MLKYCAVFSLCANLGFAADYLTGQGARAIIGQPNFTAQDSGASNTLFGSAGGLAFANNTLFVAEGNRLGLLPINNRVLLYTNISQALPSPTESIAPNIGRCPVCFADASLVVGQPDFVSVAPARTQTGLNLPLAVASDGQYMAVADTANNRVLLWNSIPTTMGQPADLVLGQSDFTTLGPVVVTASAFRAPQGVWIKNGKLFVADTQNNRVLIWNSIPTKNNQAADIVLGSPNFTSVPNQDLTKQNPTGAANLLLTPTSVTSDGTRLFVSDLGFNRVLIWNKIPTTNQQPADVEIGQVDFTGSTVNDSTHLCASNGVDSSNNPTYPSICAATLSFPRFALSDGTRLYIADAGNDRVLVYNTIPTQNAARADVILGEPDEFSDLVTSNSSTFSPNLEQSASNSLPTPTSLAWDGTNLYVADPSNFRILVFTPADPAVASDGIRNAASIDLFALGTITLGGSIQAKDAVTITIDSATYTYTVLSTDTLDTITTALANLINAGSGDPNVLATAQLGFEIIQLVARVGGETGNNITIAASVNTNAKITATASGTNLTRGLTASTIAPGTLVSILGTSLADSTAAADPHANGLPLELGGVQFYVDGMRAPLLYVSPTQVNAQMPFEVNDANSVSAYLRIQHSDGTVTVTNAVGVPIDIQNPGIFAQTGPGITDPRPAFAYHGSSYASAIVSVDGSIDPGDLGTITIEDRSYSYTVHSGDTLTSVRDAFVALINDNTEEKVVASPSAAFTRILLQAKVIGPDGNGIKITATEPSAGTAVGTVTLGGSINAGDVVTVTINGVGYSYTILATDTFGTVLAALANQINAGSGDVNVNAVIQVGPQTLELVARTTGTAGNSVTLTTTVSANALITATASGATLTGGAASATAGLVLTAINPSTCCANRAGAPITSANPAGPGEIIYVLATGLGVVLPQAAADAETTGYQYLGPVINDPVSFVSGTAGGLSTTILSAGLEVGAIGVYKVVMQLDSSVTTNALTQLTISQGIYTSNIVTIPVYAVPNP
jgi:uncharacterized protein (TIGR03437 family)